MRRGGHCGVFSEVGAVEGRREWNAMACDWRSEDRVIRGRMWDSTSVEERILMLVDDIVVSLV